MKKSDRYHAAMVAVIEYHGMRAADKIEIIELLISDRNIAKWSEEQEAKKEA